MGIPSPSYLSAQAPACLQPLADDPPRGSCSTDRHCSARSICLTWHEEHLPQKGGTSSPLTSPLAHQHRQERESKGLADSQATIRCHAQSTACPALPPQHRGRARLRCSHTWAGCSRCPQPEPPPLQLNSPSALRLLSYERCFIPSSPQWPFTGLSPACSCLSCTGEPKRPLMLQTTAGYPSHHKITDSLTQGRSPR